LKEKLNHGEFCDFSQVDIHVVSNILKLFLREMPVPVITFNLYEPLMELAAHYIEMEIDVFLYKLKRILQELPDLHYKLLFYVARFLLEMSSYSEITKMGVENLSIIFAANILRSETETLEISSSSLPSSITIFRTIITYSDKLYEERISLQSNKSSFEERWIKDISQLLEAKQSPNMGTTMRRAFSSPEINSEYL